MPQGQRGAWRTMLGDDGNQFGAHSALSIPHLNGSFPVFILGWTIGAIGGWPSRNDAMTIAQPFMAGSSINQMEKSREGRQNGSFIPDGTF
jgi:hypothetical protein